MAELVLDVVMIALLLVAIFYAVKLQGQMAALRAGRVEMERFVHEFNGTVLRAETSMKGLKQAARSSGDDLEQLLEKAQKIMDELTFLTESADQVATRVSEVAVAASQGAKSENEKKVEAPSVTISAFMPSNDQDGLSAPSAKPRVKQEANAKPLSAAEMELKKALEKNP